MRLTVTRRDWTSLVAGLGQVLVPPINFSMFGVWLSAMQGFQKDSFGLILGPWIDLEMWPRLGFIPHIAAGLAVATTYCFHGSRRNQILAWILLATVNSFGSWHMLMRG